MSLSRYPVRSIRRVRSLEKVNKKAEFKRVKKGMLGDLIYKKTGTNKTLLELAPDIRESILIDYRLDISRLRKLYYGY